MSAVNGKLELMHLVEKLKLQKRTGWVREKVDGAESIADHMYRMAILSLLSEEDDELDVAKCVQMAVVHDLAEAEVGDITPFDGISREEKQAREAVSGAVSTSDEPRLNFDRNRRPCAVSLIHY